MAARDFLFEIGCEELPPKSLFTLGAALCENIVKGLDQAQLSHGAAQWFATPRRLAVRVLTLADRQPDQHVRRQGPAIAHAFDANAQPTKAALGFAASCGVSVEQLERVETPKGLVLQFTAQKPGESTVTLLPTIVRTALAELPIARRMRWGAGDQEFVRPVHWVVLLFGASVIEADVLGVQASKFSRGHRFHAPRPLAIASPAKYEQTLRDKGHVLVDVQERRERIRSGVDALASALGGRAVIEPALLDEVTALVEWPAPLAGRFDERYLALPEEAPIASMQDHQRYFPVRSADGRLLNAFIAVANIESREPDKVRDGNERVIRPRLADAAFFWDTDRREPLDAKREALKAVTYQNKLGSVFDKSVRVETLAARIAVLIDADEAQARRAAQLAKCDLLTMMVGEFPELQGVMGKHYARLSGESCEVSVALEEQYLPRFAGDRLPDSMCGVALSLADKLDTIAGIFALGQKPTGTRDPFGVRRAAIGVLRIVLDRRLDLDLHGLTLAAINAQPLEAPAAVAEEMWGYLLDRLRGLYAEDAMLAVAPEMFDAVLATQPSSPIDFDARLRALTAFLRLPEAASLASANKRIANILRKASGELSEAVDTAKLQAPAEQQLFEHVLSMERAVNPLFARREYTQALTQLASLRSDVDRFFDDVMVMTEDAEVRSNRLGLLLRLRGLFLHVADLSRLPG